MSRAVDELASRTPGKKALAIESFGRALRALPSIIAENGGFDSAELVSQLRAAHMTNVDCSMGLDMVRGVVGDVRELGITESLKLKRQVLLSASEAAEMIIRVDNIVKAAPRKRSNHSH